MQARRGGLCEVWRGTGKALGNYLVRGYRGVESKHVQCLFIVLVDAELEVGIQHRVDMEPRN